MNLQRLIVSVFAISAFIGPAVPTNALVSCTSTIYELKRSEIFTSWIPSTWTVKTLYLFSPSILLSISSASSVIGFGLWILRAHLTGLGSTENPHFARWVCFTKWEVGTQLTFGGQYES